MSSGMLSHQESNKHRNTIIIHSIHSRLKQNAYALVWFLENEIIHLHIRATLKLLTCPCSVLRKKNPVIIQLWESTDHPPMWDGDLDELHTAVATDTFLFFLHFCLDNRITTTS